MLLNCTFLQFIPRFIFPVDTCSLSGQVLQGLTCVQAHCFAVAEEKGTVKGICHPQMKVSVN